MTTEERIMNLRNYTSEELKAELKRRTEETKADKEKVKRCRHCKHLLCKNFKGEEVERDSNRIFGCQCKVTTSKIKPYHMKYVSKSQKACDKFENYNPTDVPSPKFNPGDKVIDSIGYHIVTIVECVFIDGVYNYTIRYDDGSCAFINEDKLTAYGIQD